MTDREKKFIEMLENRISMIKENNKKMLLGEWTAEKDQTRIYNVGMIQGYSLAISLLKYLKQQEKEND